MTPRLIVSLVALLIGGVSSPAGVARFSSGTPGALPAGWHEQRLGHAGPTHYRLVQDEGRVALEADSRAAASALVADVDAAAATASGLEWSWKIDHVLPGARWGRRGGDDFPARVFVIFAGDAAMPLSNPLTSDKVRVLNYVWANDGDAGRMRASPYAGNVMMIAVEAGPARAGAWVTERRDILEDFRRAFHAVPPPVRAVAVMTDTDNTRTRETTLYGDIRFVGEPGLPLQDTVYAGRVGEMPAPAAGRTCCGMPDVSSLTARSAVPERAVPRRTASSGHRLAPPTSEASPRSSPRRPPSPPRRSPSR